MKRPQKKHIIIVLLSVFVLTSCRAKKKTFNGTETLNCADHNQPLEAKEKKKTKWRLILYKDGHKVGGKSKKGKSRLFKKKE